MVRHDTRWHSVSLCYILQLVSAAKCVINEYITAQRSNDWLSASVINHTTHCCNWPYYQTFLIVRGLCWIVFGHNKAHAVQICTDGALLISYLSMQTVADHEQYSQHLPISKILRQTTVTPRLRTQLVWNYSAYCTRELNEWVTQLSCSRGDAAKCCLYSKLIANVERTVF